MTIFFTLLSLLSNYGAAKTLAFEVLSILPSRIDSGRQRLGGNTPLTVVFSLPVIRLGTPQYVSSLFTQKNTLFSTIMYFIDSMQ